MTQASLISGFQQTQAPVDLMNLDRRRDNLSGEWLLASVARSVRALVEEL